MVDCCGLQSSMIFDFFEYKTGVVWKCFLFLPQSCLIWSFWPACRRSRGLLCASGVWQHWQHVWGERQPWSRSQLYTPPPQGFPQLEAAWQCLSRRRESTSPPSVTSVCHSAKRLICLFYLFNEILETWENRSSSLRSYPLFISK